MTFVGTDNLAPGLSLYHCVYWRTLYCFHWGCRHRNTLRQRSAWGHLLERAFQIAICERVKKVEPGRRRRNQTLVQFHWRELPCPKSRSWPLLPMPWSHYRLRNESWLCMMALCADGRTLREGLSSLPAASNIQRRKDCQRGGLAKTQIIRHDLQKFWLAWGSRIFTDSKSPLGTDFTLWQSLCYTCVL